MSESWSEFWFASASALAALAVAAAGSRCLCDNLCVNWLALVGLAGCQAHAHVFQKAFIVISELSMRLRLRGTEKKKSGPGCLLLNRKVVKLSWSLIGSGGFKQLKTCA